MELIWKNRLFSRTIYITKALPKRKGFTFMMKLSGKNDADVVIRVLRFPVVHVRTLSISLTDVDKVVIRRLLSLLISLFFTKKRQKVPSLYIIWQYDYTRKEQVVSYFFSPHTFDCTCQSKFRITKRINYKNSIISYLQF